jgi:hypothetical protein
MEVSEKKMKNFCNWELGAQINFGDLTPYLTYDSKLNPKPDPGKAHTVSTPKK